MINIEDNFNYLQITDTTDRLNPRIAMYPKKSTTFDIILNNVENDFVDDFDDDFDDSERVERRIDDDGGNPITPIDPIGPINDNRSIYIRRSGGGILLSAKLFAEMKILIGGRSNSIDDVIVFLSENTSI
jgi:hypothetical protein